MSTDRAKTLHQAQLLASKGQYDAAIAEWKKLAAEAPHDGSIHNSIGDLHLKRNANTEAITAFLQAAAAFRADGATLKAIAAFKKVLKIDPTRYEIYRHLGDLNAERGLLSSAVHDYLTIGKHYLKEGKGKDALEIYKKIVDQDPSNLDAQQRVAELCIQENQQDEATKVYLQLGRERSAQGRFAEARDAYLAVLRIDPKNSEAEQFVASVTKGGAASSKDAKPGAAPGAQKSSEPLDLLGEATRRMNEKQYAGAEAILNQLLTREPGNPQVCQLLARLHLQRGEVQVALGEYRFLAGAALRAQDYTLAESLIAEFLSAQPNSVPILELSGELYEEKGDGAAAAQQYAKAVEGLLERPEPGMESLHEELFEKVKSLSPDADVVNRLAARIAGGQPVETSGSPAVKDMLAISVEPPVSAEPANNFSVAGAGPDDAWTTTSKIRPLQDRHLPVQCATPDGVVPIAKGTNPEEANFSVKNAELEGNVFQSKAPAADPAPSPMPVSPPAFSEQVRAAVSAGQHREVEQILAKWLSQEPDNCDARECLGRVYDAKGDSAGAALQYARALELLMAQTGLVQRERCLSLYRKVKELAPASPVVDRLAPSFAPQPAAEPPVVQEAHPVPAGLQTGPAANDQEAEAHYTLGVAYKNMGLYAEAKEEFQASMGRDAFYLDSCLMTALCFKEEQQFAQAICMLEPVLYDPRCQSAKGQAIRYELGLLYEAEAQWEDAAKTYQSIPSFHDVPQRLASLKGRYQPPAAGLRCAG